MMRRSETAGCAPFMLASITVRAVSSAPPSCFDGSALSSVAPPLRPKPCGAALPNTGTALPNVIPLIAAAPPLSRVKCGLHACFQRRATLARLVEGQNAARGVDVEAAEIVFQ